MGCSTLTAPSSAVSTRKTESALNRSWRYSSKPQAKSRLAAIHSPIDKRRFDGVQSRLYSGASRRVHHCLSFFIIPIREGLFDMARTRHSAEPYSSVTPSLESVFQVSSASFSTHETDFAHALFAPMHYTPGMLTR